MKRAMIAGALLGALLAGVPATAGSQSRTLPGAVLPGGAGVVLGTGSVVGSDCGGPVVIEGVSLTGTQWTFSAQVVAQDLGIGCALILSLSVASGQWNPATGGCVPPAPGSGGMCIGPIPNTGQGTNVAVSICTGTGGCFNGTASLTRL